MNLSNETIRLYTYLFSMAFCIVLAFGQFGDFLIRHRFRDLLASFIFLALVAAFFFRVMVFASFPIFTEQQIVDGIVVSHLLASILAFLWGILRLWERHVLGLQLYRLKQEMEKENGTHER